MMINRYFILGLLIFGFFFGCQQSSDKKKEKAKSNLYVDPTNGKRIVQEFLVNSIKVEQYRKTKKEFLEQYISLNDSFGNWARLKSHFLKKYSAKQVDSIGRIFNAANDQYCKFYTLKSIFIDDLCVLYVVYNEMFNRKTIYVLSIDKSGKLNYTFKMADKWDNGYGYGLDRRSILYEGNILRIIEYQYIGGDVDGYYRETPIARTDTFYYRLGQKSIEVIKFKSLKIN